MQTPEQIYSESAQFIGMVTHFGIAVTVIGLLYVIVSMFSNTESED